MSSLIGINLFFLLIIGSGLVSCEIFPKQVVVEEGQGFLLWLKQSNDIVNCSLEFNDPANTFEHDDRRVQSTEFGHIQSMPRLDYKECAFRVKGVTRKSEGLWSIIYSYDSYAKNRDGAEVKVVAPKDTAQTENCWLYNPKTQEKKMCSEIDATSSSSDNWQRHSLVSGSMEGKSNWINGPTSDTSSSSPALPAMSAIHGSYKFGQLKSTPGMDHILLECAYISGPRICRVKHLSSNRVFNVRPGLQSSDKRYSAFNTNSRDLERCQFEISTPIILKDVGIWEMTAGSGKCHFLVRPSLQDSFVLPTKEPNSTSFMKTKPVTVSLTVPCAKNLFYPINRCYILSRSSPEIEMEYKNAVDLSANNGKCEFSKDSSVSEWYCSYSGPSMESTDIDLNFLVKRYRTDLVEAKVLVQRDHSVVVECHEINGDPIEACAIIDPEGRVYSVPSDTFEDTKQLYSYYGIGLARGNCGIRVVHAVNMKKNGTWKFFVTMENGKEHFLDFHYSENQ